MNKTLLITLLIATICTPSFALTDICDLSISPDPKSASFALGEQVTLSLSYTTDEASGVRIFARPFSGGSLTPGYSASGSPLYTGSGTASSSFTINSGNVLVDEVRVEVYASDNSTLLRRFWIPVHFSFGTAGAHSFTYSHAPALASFLLGESFTSTFQYNVTQPGGVRIFVRPFSNGALTPGYSASGSAIYTGNGTANASFTINSGKNVHVDALRVKITNADQTLDLEEFFIPVNLYFSTVKITDIQAQNGNFPYNGDERQMDFKYSTTEAGGVRIFPRPWTVDGLTPGYSASGSPLYNGSGNGSSTFTISNGNQRVDHVRFNVVNADQSETLLQFLAPVEYTFGNFLVENIQLCPPAPARLEHDAPVHIHWNYYNDQGEDVRVFVRPMTNGALTPAYAASGSPAYVDGTGTAQGHFTITSGDVRVDQLRFLVTNADQSSTLAEYFIPVNYTFGQPTTPLVEQTGDILKLSLNPNPVVETATLSLTLQAPDKVQVSIRDLSGRLVAVQASRQVSAGVPESFEIRAGDLPAGAYFLTVEGRRLRQTEKLVVVK